MSHRQVCFILGHKSSLSLLEPNGVAEKEMWAWPQGKVPRPPCGRGRAQSAVDGLEALVPLKPMFAVGLVPCSVGGTGAQERRAHMHCVGSSGQSTQGCRVGGEGSVCVDSHLSAEGKMGRETGHDYLAPQLATGTFNFFPKLLSRGERRAPCTPPGLPPSPLPSPLGPWGMVVRPVAPTCCPFTLNRLRLSGEAGRGPLCMEHQGSWGGACWAEAPQDPRGVFPRPVGGWGRGVSRKSGVRHPPLSRCAGGNDGLSL